MSRFPTPTHLASWARFAPRVKESAGRNNGPSPLQWTQCLKAARSVGSSSYGFDPSQFH